ncbi:substrate-binding periplasmic protein [Chthonobacter albigriseus]|uniref:substrate-binding periplasmic protein n=1 Tax=Chthonobacter albigriseus TaxID=1683161 RepID=UPI0015EE7C34|nr:transporter substrate-binding domain-containing protein [Chthonobacter albigriseus]
MTAFTSRILAVALATVFSTEAVLADCLPAIKEKGVLLSANGLMGTKPYVWKDEKTGTYLGYEAELFAEITKRLGIAKWDYAITEWTTMIPGLKAERWDIILSGMSVTQERIQGAGIQYSNPYFMLYDVVIVEEGSDIKSMDDLKGKTVGTTLGTLDSINAHILKDAGKVGEVMDFNTFGEPFVALKNKQVDAVVLDQTTYLGMQNDIGGLRTVGEPIYYNAKPGWEDKEKDAPYVFGGTAIGVRVECEDLRLALNETLAAMDADGTRKAILEKYGVWSPEQVKLMK